MLTRLFPVFVLTLAAAPLCAQYEPPPGAESTRELTIEERVAQRQALAQEVGGRSTIRIDGKKTPHLFYRWELVNRLVHAGFVVEPEARQVFRLDVDRRLRDAGMAGADWEQLERLLAPVIANQRESRRLASARNDPNVDRQEATEKLETVQAQTCAARALSVENARAFLGTNELDALLYRGVAPSTFVVFFASSENVEAVRRVSEGCQ